MVSNDKGSITTMDDLGNNITQSTFKINEILGLFAGLFQKVQEFFVALESLLKSHPDFLGTPTWEELKLKVSSWMQSKETGPDELKALRSLVSVDLAEDVLFSKQFKSISF